MFAGDGMVDGKINAVFEEQSVWANAWGTTFRVRENEMTESQSFRAMREADPQTTQDEGTYARQYYYDHLMLFTGIQVAGPRLTPATVDRGVHAIPPTRNADPFVPDCRFEPGGYTCVKDAAEQWWDPAGTTAPDDPPGAIAWSPRAGGRSPASGRAATRSSRPHRIPATTRLARAGRSASDATLRDLRD